MTSRDRNDIKKVLLIDPWGIGSTGNYTKGLIHGLISSTELTVVTNFYFENEESVEYKLFNCFFKRTEKMKRSFIRSIGRGIEYYMTYCWILRLIKNKKFDVVHINWLLMYKVDIHFLKKIKKQNVKIVYTAHNVLPHVQGTKQVRDMEKIYSIVDKIIVHGYEVEKEFLTYFPQYENKLYIQKHGCNLVPKTRYNISEIEISIQEKIQQYSKRYIFFGNIFYNKGVDFLLDEWLKKYRDKDILLIVAGKKRESYKELDLLESKVNEVSNILYLNEFIEDNLLNYLIDSSELILLPYRHASMSGVVFTAADFKKTLLCTSVGALEEYLTDGQDSFVTRNISDFLLKLEELVSEEKTELLLEMGNKLYSNIHDTCNWDSIVNQMMKECY